MTRNTKPAAVNAAGSRIDALSWPAKPHQSSHFYVGDQCRAHALRWLAEFASMAASEATNRDSRERLRAATACIFDALAFERRAAQCGRRA
jgi:hypothetical protein